MLFQQFLIIVSTSGCGFFLLSMGMFDYTKNVLLVDVSAYSWIPLLSLSGVALLSASGMMSLPYVVAAEILPQKVRKNNCQQLIDSF